jgi:hypothetical protein
VGAPALLGWITVLQAAAPIYMQNDHLFGGGMVLLGHPTRSPTYCVRASNRSGIWKNSKLNATAVTTDVLHRLIQAGVVPPGAAGIAAMLAMMDQRHPNLAYLNRGDNVAIWATSQYQLDRAVGALLADPRTLRAGAVYRFGQDPYAQFDGYDFYLHKGGLSRQPNLDAAALKFIVPEHSWSSRMAPALGTYERFRRMGTAFAGPRYLDILARMFHRLTGRDLMVALDLLQRLERDRLGALALTPIDIEVLGDPSKLLWKYSAADVSPTVRDAILSLLPPAELLRHQRLAYAASEAVPPVPEVQA